jgi:hypothetical protein
MSEEKRGEPAAASCQAGRGLGRSTRFGQIVTFFAAPHVVSYQVPLAQALNSEMLSSHSSYTQGLQHTS